MSFVNGKNIWPMYVPPYNDELFSSWFFRLSSAHLLKNHTFARNYFENSSNIWARDIDRLAPTELVNIIVSHTPLTRDKVFDLFLTSYEGIVTPIVNKKSFSPGILPLGIIHRKRLKKGLLFCPSCLSEKPYFKKQWRLAFNFFCLKCNCELLDSCQSCSYPVSFHRLEYKNTSFIPSNISYCICGNNLSFNKQNYIISENEKRYQNFIDNTMLNRYNSFSQYSFLFFEVFFLLINKYGYKSKTKKNIFRESFENYFGLENLLDKKSCFESWTFTERKKAAIDVFLLFEKSEKDIISFIKQFNISKSYISSDKIIPFWFLKIIKEFS